MSRRYADMLDLDAAAARIAFEVVREGESTGWSGSLEDLAAVKALLEPFNIRYVDDMRGGWERREPATTAKTGAVDEVRAVLEASTNALSELGDDGARVKQRARIAALEEVVAILEGAR